MEFTQYTCPVCDKRFENGDDVVVCPECGTPHHRDCWEKTGCCFYEDRHAEGFSFENANAEDKGSDSDNSSNVTICPHCKAENEKTSFYCGTCGFPLNTEDRKQENSRQDDRNQPQSGMPFGFGAAGNPMYDPMAGLNSEDELAEGVTVGEAAKYVGKSTPYYLLVFNRIKQFGSGKFNFSAFLFSGAFFIYRKMYVPGIILMLLMIGVTVGSAALMLSNSWMSQLEYKDLLDGVYNGGLGAGKMGVLMASAGLNLLRIGIMVFSGLFANKYYYRHCIKHIRLIKNENKDGDVNKELEVRGGVNLPMAISFFAAFIVIYEICNFYLIFQL